MADSKALKLYVCNVATEPGETLHYGVEEHLAALKLHAPSEIFKVALVNDRTNVPSANGSYELIELSKDKSTIDGLPIATADVIDVDKPSQHDPVKLAQAVMQVYSDYGDVEARPEARRIRENEGLLTKRHAVLSLQLAHAG